MSDVRDTLLFNEQGAEILTLAYDTSIVRDANRYDGLNGSAQVGDLVALVSDSTVGLGTTGNYPFGKLLKVEITKCSVQVGGVMQVPYVSANANPPIVGRGIQVDGAGNAISPAGGVRLALERGIVLSLDATNQVCSVYFP